MAATSVQKQQLFISKDLDEDLCATAYLRLKAEGLLEIVYYEGAPTLRWFLDWCKSRGNCLLGCFLDQPSKLAGMAWLNCVTDIPARTPKGSHRKAEVSIVFFREFQRSSLPELFLEQVLAYAFRTLDIDVLYGTSPVDNRSVLMFSKRMGFTQIGPLPAYTVWKGEPTGAMISVLRREDWEGGD